MDRGSLAVKMHKEDDYNCAQSVLCAFEDLTGLERKTALAITDGLGGGFRCGEICGALSGAVIAAGIILKNRGENPVRSPKIKAVTIELSERFKEMEKNLTCRDLVAENGRELCNKFIEDAVKILEEILKGENI